MDIFTNPPIISESSEPRFTLWECLQQIFGYDFIGNDFSAGSYINHHEDGFYDTSIRAYLPTIAEWILRHCRLKGVQLSEEQKEYARDLNMYEPSPEEWDTIREVRAGLAEVYNFVQPPSNKKADDMIHFFEDMYIIWKAQGIGLLESNPLENSVSVEELNSALLTAFAQSENLTTRDKAMRIIASQKKVW